jgi:hypothetical protein
MPTTRDQYVGLNDVVLSTRMKVIGTLEMEGRRRRIWIMFALFVSAALGGMKTPSSRKDLMFEVRRSEEAEGERRMMGRRLGCLGFFVRLETRAGCGAPRGFESGRERKNCAAVLR